jgi:Ala-tRNA(Pro) deacylase
MLLLDGAQVAFTTERHDRAYTAQEVAQLTHVRGKEMIKAVVVVADGRHILVALPASSRIDLAKLRAALGADDVRLAEEREFLHDFPDCETGGMPPIGKPYGLRLLASDAIRADAEVVFNAGNHTEIVRMRREDWESLARPEYGAFTRP